MPPPRAATITGIDDELITWFARTFATPRRPRSGRSWAPSTGSNGRDIMRAIAMLPA